MGYFTKFRTVEYHSKDWEILVEVGYITMYVENGTATMLYHKGRQ